MFCNPWLGLVSHSAVQGRCGDGSVCVLVMLSRLRYCVDVFGGCDASVALSW